MRFAVFDETKDGETRVALVPDAVKMLLKKQHAVSVQSGAGRAASIPDAEFTAAGAQLCAEAGELARTFLFKDFRAAVTACCAWAR